MQLSVVIICSLLYISLLFFTAWWVDRRADQGQSVVRNPYIYSLSLAVYCTAWTFFGSVGRASVGGLSFLPIYLGPALMAPLWLMILHKMVLVSKHQRITSVADFISARYGKSTFLASTATLIALVGNVPYISIQLKAVSFGIDILTEHRIGFIAGKAPILYDSAFWVTVAMALFTILFGTRKLDPNERHEGMVAAIAFESMVKLIAFFGIGIFVTFGLYDGFGDIFNRAVKEPEIRKLFSLQSSGVSVWNWNMLLLLSALAILFLPRQFHISVVENTHPKHLRTAMWVFPLYLLLINVFVFPIALAGRMEFGPHVNPDTYVLSLPLTHGSEFVAMLAFLGGLSAATGMIVVSTTAISIMISNHLVVPLMIRMQAKAIGKPAFDGVTRLLDIRRVSILLVLLMAYTYLRKVGSGYDLVSVGLISFTAVAQFAPAALGGLFWKRATHQGAMAGLVTGFIIWAYTLPLPSMAEAGLISDVFEKQGLFGINWLRPGALFGLEGMETIPHAAFWSLLLNTLTYMLVSLNTQPSALTIRQADVFINISRYTAGQDYDPVKRQAKMLELRQVLERFLNRERMYKILTDYEKRSGESLAGLEIAPPGLINYVERHLTGAIGSASASLLVNSITTESPITMEEIMLVLEQTQEVLEYSRALEAKSAELEATTQQLTLANEQLKTLDRMKADFITTVTHELRTPVTSIKALSKIILDYRDELSYEKLESYLRILVSESERISRLINQVLDIEKIQNAGLETGLMELVDCVEIVKGAVTGMDQLFAEKGVGVETSLPAGNVAVNGNRDRLIQVVVNLLSNALKFVQPVSGQVKIELRVEGNRAILEVSDNGIGIPQEKQAIIFEKFTQLSDRITGKPHGSGLGLFITKTIVEQHGGSIGVSSKSGEGAVFVVDLPLATAPFTPQ